MAIPLRYTTYVPLAREDRAARPLADLNEDNFNAAAFDGYCDVVLQCTKAASATSSPHVQAEAEGVIRKMRGLLHQGVKHEVDFVEATKDTSYILARWMNGQPAGKKAFIPDLGDRDECYAALKIFTCAGEEAEQIPGEYVAAFGEDGVHIYNELTGLVGERDKKCLPFVNMCLRAWKDKLSEDADLWADLSVLDFDKCFSQWIPCASIIRSIRTPVTLDWVGQHYRLRSALNTHIEQQGDTSY